MKWINDVVFAILAAHVWGSLMREKDGARALSFFVSEL